MGFDLFQSSPQPNWYDRHVIPHSQVVDGNLYFYGISKLLFGTTTTNRFPYVNMLDLTLFKFGSHVAISQQVEGVNSAPWTSGGAYFTYGTFSSGIDSTDLSGTRTYTELDVDEFEIYDINKKYLEYGTSNSFISSVDLGIADKQFFYTNGDIGIIELP